jgi:hypothetical protein
VEVFFAADVPEANEMVAGITAVVAEAERKMISARTKQRSPQARVAAFALAASVVALRG